MLIPSLDRDSKPWLEETDDVTLPDPERNLNLNLNLESVDIDWCLYLCHVAGEGEAVAGRPDVRADGQDLRWG